MGRKRKEYRLCFYLDNEQEKYIVEKIAELQNRGLERITSKEIFVKILYKYFRDREQSGAIDEERTAEWYMQQIYIMLKNCTCNKVKEMERQAPECAKRNGPSENDEESLPSGVVNFINSMIE